MQSEVEAIKRLRNSKSKVSCHYLINRKGKVIRMVDDTYIAWHAGKSRWKNFVNLNKNSLGIELVNNGFEKFPLKQMNSLVLLLKYLKNKYKIDKKYVLGHSHIAPDRKIDPGPLFPWFFLAKRGLSKLY